MICSYCTYILTLLEENNIDLKDLDNPPIFLVGYHNSEHCLCSNCGYNFTVGDLYVNDKNALYELEELAITFLSNKISNKIESCSYCDGSTIENYLRLLNDNEDYSDQVQYDIGKDIYDLLSEYGVNPTDFLGSNIIKKLHCCKCGHGGNSDTGYFSIDDKVYCNDEIDSFYGRIEYLGLKYGIKFSKLELEKFVVILQENIMLAGMTDTGKKIFDLILEVFKNKDENLISCGTILYRGRKRAKKDTAYNNQQLWNPPANKSSQGRYNIIGSSMLYLCDDIKMIPHELKLCGGECIDIAKFEIIRNLYLFNVEEIFSEYGDFLYIRSESSDIVKNEYLLCNYIAQCCKKAGFDGVRYPSNIDNKSYNFGIFDIDLKYKLKIESVKCLNFKIKYESS